MCQSSQKREGQLLNFDYVLSFPYFYLENLNMLIDFRFSAFVEAGTEIQLLEETFIFNFLGNFLITI